MKTKTHMIQVRCPNEIANALEMFGYDAGNLTINQYSLLVLARHVKRKLQTREKETEK